MTSIWHIWQRAELLDSPRELHVFTTSACRHSVVTTRSAVWVMSEWGSGARVASRVAFAPGTLTVEDVHPGSDRHSVDVVTSSVIGVQHSVIRVDPKDGTVSASTTLTPAADMECAGWPRDLVADLGAGVEATVHTAQRGLRTGLVHVSLGGSAAGSFMYLQDLSVLGDYCDATHASGKDTVSGDWPDIGFSLPVGTEPLKAGTDVPINSWHIAFADDVPANVVEVADQYLGFLAQLYLHIDRPTPGYVDWRDRAQRCRQDIERCRDCWTSIDGTRYLRAYVGDDKHPPESMVQLAVLLPLIERQAWMEELDPLVGELSALPIRFADDRTKTIARWLPEAEDMLDGTEPHEKPRLMDSWYLFHPLLNLARLAEHGNEEARQQLLDSLDAVIDVAHHFEYDWPVFYDVDTLEVIKAETEPGKGGEQDVPGLYAHVMLQAFDLTNDRRYLDEAVDAARSLRDKGFELTYQTNNVAFGMVATLRLAQITGDQEFADISRVLCACLFDNIGLWSTRYGHARERSSFFGVFPMPTAPYVAAYEQAEVAATCLDYLLRADELLPATALLLPELIRHVTARLDTFYPINIDEDALADSPKTGHMRAELWVPVEDIGDGWDQAGTVGQEVYGAGIAFSTVARSYVKLPDGSVQVYCEYPYSTILTSPDRIELRVWGDLRLHCRLRVHARHRGSSAPCRVIGSVSGEIGTAAHERDWWDYWVPAGQDVTVRFDGEG